MNVPLRILRAIASNHQDPRPLSPRERETRAVILAAAADMLAQAGRLEVTLARLARALRISAVTLQRYFACMDELLHTILSDQLDSLSAALEAVPDNAPNCHLARRRAYRAAMLTADGELRIAHMLLLTQAAILPADLEYEIAARSSAIGEAIAPGIGKFALMLLNDPDLPLAEAEAYIALKTRRPAAAVPQPEPPRQPAPAPRPMVAIARTLASPAIMHPLTPEPTPKSELWASTALQHQARAGP